MDELQRQFDFVAVDPSGRRKRGSITAEDDAAVFERLRREGMTPLSIRPTPARAGARKTRDLSDRDVAELLHDLAALLKAGADMRAALDLLAARSAGSAIQGLCKALKDEISGGGAMDQAFRSRLKASQEFVAALVAAGEAGGDLPAGLQRAAELIDARTALRDQLVSTLSYPAFVFASTIAAVIVILLFVVPSLAPLVAEAGSERPFALGILISASDFLRLNLATLAVLLGLLVGAIMVAGRLGLLAKSLDRLLLNGPIKRTTGGLVFGGFAITLGNMLAAGAPMSDALRLAVRAVRSPAARGRLEPVIQSVRQGQSLSAALTQVRAFPITIARLAAVGEVSGGLGPMLARGGKIEEDAAVRRLEATVRVAGPALIVALGGLIGLLMASLLSGVSTLGQAALQ